MRTTTQEPDLQELAEEVSRWTAVAAGLADGTEDWREWYPAAHDEEAARELAQLDMQRAWDEYEQAGGSTQS